MGKKGTTTYEYSGAKKGFDFPLFAKAFKKRAKEQGVRLGEFERMLGDATGVSSDAVHQWRNARSAPGDKRAVACVAEFLGLGLADLLCEAEEKKMDRLNERQRDAVARVYREIEDYLYLFEQADGFVWKKYRVQAGSVFSKYVTTWTDFAMEGKDKIFDEGADLAEAALNWVGHALEREWVDLGDHPIYGELAEYIDDTLLEVWNGKTDPDYRLEPYGPDDVTDRSAWTEASRALKRGREIILRYL